MITLHLKGMKRNLWKIFIPFFTLVLIAQNTMNAHASNSRKVFSEPFSYGIVMGYYGQLWPQEVYADYANYAARYGQKFFIYAPKEDFKLRDDWRIPFSDDEINNLREIRDAFESKGVAFGIGLSPHNLNRLSDNDKEDLAKKIHQINLINPSILGIFFDDIDKSAIIPNLGAIQVKIAEFSATMSSAREFISVPTYYSNDEILQRLLGPMPENYFSDFGKLDKKFAIMWTGSHIISPGFSDEELNKIAEIMKRKVVLWDNYPVNDPLYLRDYARIYALTGRTKKISKLTKGYAMNPMSQPYLSMIPMATAKDLFGSRDYNPEEAFIRRLNELTGPELAEDIRKNVNYFILKGIRNTAPSNIIRMKKIFSAYSHSPQKEFASELLEILHMHGASNPY